MGLSRHPRVALAALAVLVPVPAAVARPHRAPLPAVTAHRILTIARAELARDVREIPAGSDQGPRIRMYTLSTTPSAYPNPWCAYFVSWVTQRAGVPIGAHGHGIGAVDAVATWAARTGRWHRAPKPSN